MKFRIKKNIPLVDNGMNETGKYSIKYLLHASHHAQFLRNEGSAGPPQLPESNGYYISVFV